MPSTGDIVVKKTLRKISPTLLLVDKILGVLLWNYNSLWTSTSISIAFVIFILNFEILIRYGCHFLILIILYFWIYLGNLSNLADKTIITEDDFKNLVNDIVRKQNILLHPFISYDKIDIRKSFFSIILFSPVISILIYRYFTMRYTIITVGLSILTYHSPLITVIRTYLWEIISMQRFFSSIDRILRDDISFMNKQTSYSSNNKENTKEKEKNEETPIRFTYILYENQRKWIGLGWTNIMLPYERSSWTDEFLNPANSPDSFQLPKTNSPMKWKWYDKTWLLDTSNNGIISSRKNKDIFSSNPTRDEGFMYYDNTWKKPSTLDLFSKYTRRRMWRRAAELCDD